LPYAYRIGIEMLLVASIEHIERSNIGIQLWDRYVDVVTSTRCKMYAPVYSNKIGVFQSDCALKNSFQHGYSFNTSIMAPVENFTQLDRVYRGQ